MPGFLDQYGAGDERRAKDITRVVLAVVVAGVAGGILAFLFHNFRQERQGGRFFALLAAQQYKEAYALWGCTDTQPCRDYAFGEFLRDWGPESGRGDLRQWRVTKSRSCGSGVILTASGGGREEKLWVQRGDLTIGFSPWPGCPAGR